MVREAQRYRASLDRPEVLDLSKRWEDVRRIARSHPAWRWCLDAGWDVEDLLSEVMVRVLARQGMPSRYDPARAGVAKYLYVACGSIMRNLAAGVKLGTREEFLDDPTTMDENEDPMGLEWADTVEFDEP